MKTIIRPAEHVRELLGIQPVLILGDIDRTQIALYSNACLQGYKPEGDVYSKRISMDDALLDKNKPLLLDGHAAVYPGRKAEKSVDNGPDEVVRELFGVSGSFGYIPSATLLEHYYPKVDIGLKVLPSDVSFSHEGAHVVSVNQIKTIGNDYLEMISEALRKAKRRPDVTVLDLMREALNETVAFFVEGRYVDDYFPHLKSWYEERRLEGQHPEHIEADRLVREEPEKVERMVSQIREMNQGS